jgi:large subunit ribosomal protein L23
MAKNILLKPIISEKTQGELANQNKYAFVVAKDANKIEIGKAVEAMYGVTTTAVNTLVVPGKTVNRNRRGTNVRGMKSSYKKAYVTLAEGDAIDFFNVEAAE